MVRRQDIVLGLIFTALGLATVWLARSYSGASGTYPLVLGAVMAFLGALIVGRAMRSTSDAKRELVSAPIQLVIAAVVSMVYVGLILPLGFYTASVLLMLALPALLGFRRVTYTLLMALGFICIVYMVFTVVLEKPLPAEFWSETRMGAN